MPTTSRYDIHNLTDSPIVLRSGQWRRSTGRQQRWPEERRRPQGAQPEEIGGRAGRRTGRLRQRHEAVDAASRRRIAFKQGIGQKAYLHTRSHHAYIRHTPPCQPCKKRVWLTCVCFCAVFVVFMTRWHPDTITHLDRSTDTHDHATCART